MVERDWTHNIKVTLDNGCPSCAYVFRIVYEYSTGYLDIPDRLKHEEIKCKSCQGYIIWEENEFRMKIE